MTTKWTIHRERDAHRHPPQGWHAKSRSTSLPRGINVARIESCGAPSRRGADVNAASPPQRCYGRTLQGVGRVAINVAPTRSPRMTLSKPVRLNGAAVLSRPPGPPAMRLSLLQSNRTKARRVAALAGRTWPKDGPGRARLLPCPRANLVIFTYRYGCGRLSPESLTHCALALFSCCSHGLAGYGGMSASFPVNFNGRVAHSYVGLNAMRFKRHALQYGAARPGLLLLSALGNTNAAAGAGDSYSCLQEEIRTPRGPAFCRSSRVLPFPPQHTHTHTHQKTAPGRNVF